MSQSDPNTATLVAEHQITLLRAIERFFSGEPIPKSVRRAYLDTPRHLFTARFYSSRKGSWITLSDSNLEAHLAELYADHPLAIYRDENGRTLSTISQPSLVLYMLHLLDVKPGMRVFELGGGSGWNAAMIGRIVGEEGHVTSIEIIEKLAASAAKTVAELGLPQVEMIAGDGSAELEDKTPFQRGVFTASAWSLPSCFFRQIETGGLLLLVLKLFPGSDLLAVLKKTDDATFESSLHFPCSFVPVTGSRPVPEPEPLHESDLPALSPVIEYTWEDIKIPHDLIASFVDFVKLVKDCQQSRLVEKAGQSFAEEFSGFESEDRQSRILFNEDRVISYGQEDALIELRRAAKRWQKAGKPGVEELELRILAPSESPELDNDQWLVRREDSQILWSLR